MIVGGVAANAYGATRATNDLDLCVRWTQANLARVSGALTALDARLRVEDSPEEEVLRLARIEPGFIAGIELSTWRTAHGDVDILRNIPGPDRYRFFDELLTRAVPLRLDGQQVRIASLDDIIESKAALSRPPDLEALPELRSLSNDAAPPPLTADTWERPGPHTEADAPPGFDPEL